MKLHKTGQGYIRHNGKTIYFGKFGTPEANRKYQAWLTGKAKPSCTLAELFTAYAAHNPSKNHKDKVAAVSVLGSLSHHRCDEYTPLVSRRHRKQLDNGKRCARHINALMQLIQRIFRWGVSVEMVPLEVWQKLKTVEPLKPHEVAHQSKRRQLVKREIVMKTLEELQELPADIIRLLLFTGARPGEICGLRASEINKNGPHGTWVYRPTKHKTIYRGIKRFVVFGIEGQKILEKHWPAKGDYLFPSAVILGHYKPSSLRQAVGHACKRAGVASWSPYQIRHLRLTELAVDKGLEIAASVAGHGEASTTRIYQHEPSEAEIKKAV